MKKSLGILCAALMLFVLAGFALAVGGEAGDPLISLNFLNNDFLAQTEKKIDAGIQADDNALLTDATSRWNGAVASAQAVVNASYVPTWTEARVKQGDILSGFTGLQVLPLTGELRVNFDSGAVVDVTDGTEVPSGSMLKSKHRYLVAEETTAVFTAVSKTAVINYCGTYHFHLSETPYYNAMARALKSLSLFRGTTTAYGEGFDLENVPNRIESLIMLIRMLGEEEAALACTAPHPFIDVPSWCEPYVAYAYEKGYSNGVGADIFGTYMESVPVIYVEFMLRALGLSSTATTDISDALVRAHAAGVLTAGECTHLETTKFLRSDVVYLSYYALQAEGNSMLPLYRSLAERGVFTLADYTAAQNLVGTDRIS